MDRSAAGTLEKGERVHAPRSTGPAIQIHQFAPDPLETIVWVAGHTGAALDDGRSLAGDFDAQFAQTFRNIEKTLTQCGCKLADIVTMQCF